MSSDDELMPQVFALRGEPNDFDMDLPPTSGQEYLRRVQLEARKVPKVVVAEIDTRHLSSKQTVGIRNTCSILPAPSGFAPDVEWQNKQAADFALVRQNLNRYKAKVKAEGLKPSMKLPRKEDVEKWCRLCFGNYKGNSPAQKPTQAGSQTQHSTKNVSTNTIMAGSHSDGSEDDSQSAESDSEVTASSGNQPELIQNSPPLLSIVSHMDQPMVIQVLEYHVNWFEATGFTPEQGRWFFALLASVEKPLVPEACSLLRNLARNCANLRATLESREDPMLSHLNLLICLVSRYFNQADLADQG